MDEWQQMDKARERWAAWLPPRDPDHDGGVPCADFDDASVMLFELSGTGLEWDCFAQIAALLRYFDDDTHPSLVQRPDLALAAEVAARADLVEYGCALRVAWLTDKGRAWLGDYEAAVREQGRVRRIPR